MTIAARDNLFFDGVGSNGVSSGAFSRVGVGAVGNGGSINIKAGSLSLSDGAALFASTYGQGNAGSIFVQASDLVALANSNIYSNVESRAMGKGGNINITTGSLDVTKGAGLIAYTAGGATTSRNKEDSRTTSPTSLALNRLFR